MATKTLVEKQKQITIIKTSNLKTLYENKLKFIIPILDENGISLSILGSKIDKILNQHNTISHEIINIDIRLLDEIEFILQCHQEAEITKNIKNNEQYLVKEDFLRVIYSLENINQELQVTNYIIEKPGRIKNEYQSAQEINRILDYLSERKSKITYSKVIFTFYEILVTIKSFISTRITLCHTWKILNHKIFLEFDHIFNHRVITCGVENIISEYLIPIHVYY